jgi:hypothetical protein
MGRFQRGLVGLGLFALALGVLLAVMPMDWVESMLGVEPDGGNGELELLLALAPLVVGIVLLAFAGHRWSVRRGAIQLPRRKLGSEGAPPLT